MGIPNRRINMPNRFFDMPSPASPHPSDANGVINAPQAVLTFAGAPAAVTIVMKVIEAINAEWGTSKLLIVLLSLFVGMLIYWNSSSSAQTRKEKFLSFSFALLNSFAIAAASLGINNAA
jgi:hypothetical protein